MQSSLKTIHGHRSDAPDAVTLIDAHHHLWDLSQRKHPNLVGEKRHDFFMGDDRALRVRPRIGMVELGTGEAS